MHPFFMTLHHARHVPALLQEPVRTLRASKAAAAAGPCFDPLLHLGGCVAAAAVDHIVKVAVLIVEELQVAVARDQDGAVAAALRADQLELARGAAERIAALHSDGWELAWMYHHRDDRKEHANRELTCVFVFVCER
jgi:hypothetical protein